jgi:hypothetical protein
MKLRFSIRDLLWLTLVCAVLVAWWIDRSDLSSQIDEQPKLGVPLRGKRETS